LAVALKIILTLVLVKIPKLGVFGAVISNTLCYLLAVFLNLMYIKLYGNKKDTNRTNPNG
jgi:Na+-driven multidrug efflux pump